MALDSRTYRLELFKPRAVSFGKFTLASGKESSYSIDDKKAIFNSEAVCVLGNLLWELTKDLNIQAIGGIEVGAIPMATAAALRYRIEGRPLEALSADLHDPRLRHQAAAIVRGERRGHTQCSRIKPHDTRRSTSWPTASVSTASRPTRAPSPWPCSAWPASTTGPSTRSA
jgi:orotate phosphoribosyltransferase